MSITVYLPLLIAALFAVVGPILARRLPPGSATWMLSVGAVVLAAATAAALALLALPLAAQLPVLARQGGWSAPVLAAHDPVRPPIAVTALVALVGLGLATGRGLIGEVAALRRSYRLAADLPAAGQLTIVDTGGPDAFVVPGRPGRIVVSPSVLRALDGRQRRALLAHERAHLINRHHLHLLATELAATANPLLRSVHRASRLSCERWADEAAAAVAGRSGAAAALARAGQLGAAVPVRPRLAAAVTDVELRLSALSRPAPRPISSWRLIVPLLLLVVCGLALGNAAAEAHALLELAQKR